MSLCIDYLPIFCLFVIFSCTVVLSPCGPKIGPTLPQLVFVDLRVLSQFVACLGECHQTRFSTDSETVWVCDFQLKLSIAGLRSHTSAQSARIFRSGVANAKCKTVFRSMLRNRKNEEGKPRRPQPKDTWEPSCCMRRVDIKRHIKLFDFNRFQRNFIKLNWFN